MRKRRSSPEISLSFLDVICCGFGAVILLLMITKIVEPQVLEKSTTSLEGRVDELIAQLFEIRGETTILNRELFAKREQRSNITDLVARLRGNVLDSEFRLQTMQKETTKNTTEVAALQNKLAIAKQKLSEVEKRLLGLRLKRQNEFIGGIPVDSEYIIFVIDSSGSMNQARARVAKEIKSTLDVYPTVKGIQVMNGQGTHLFPGRKGIWLDDTQQIRNLILRNIPDWTASDNSDPTLGIDTAIKTYYDGKKRISVYVYGDDFGGRRSIRRVIESIDRINTGRESTERLVRVHAICFPVILMDPVFGQLSKISTVQFANLMRELAFRNGGTFVGLNDFRL